VSGRLLGWWGGVTAAEPLSAPRSPSPPGSRQAVGLLSYARLPPHA